MFVLLPKQDGEICMQGGVHTGQEGVHTGQQGKGEGSPAHFGPVIAAHKVIPIGLHHVTASPC